MLVVAEVGVSMTKTCVVVAAVFDLTCFSLPSSDLPCSATPIPGSTPHRKAPINPPFIDLGCRGRYSSVPIDRHTHLLSWFFTLVLTKTSPMAVSCFLNPPAVPALITRSGLIAWVTRRQERGTQ